MLPVDYYSPAIHETASKFLDQEGFAAKYSADIRPERLSTSKARSGSMGMEWCVSPQEADEEAGLCNSPDRIARLGADQVDAEGRDRACRQLRADRPHRRRQAGLFDEVRQF